MAKKKTNPNSGAIAGVQKDMNAGAQLGSQYGMWDPKLDTLGGLSSLAGIYQGQIDPNSASYLGQRSAEMKDLLGKMEGGLAGLNSAENQALRSQAQAGIDSQYQNALYGINKQASKLRGAVATAQMQNLGRERMGQQGKLEQDLLAKNIDVQDARRNAYYNALSGQEGAEKNRVLAGQGQYGDLMSNLQGSRVAGQLGLADLIQNRRYGDEEIKLMKKGNSSDSAARGRWRASRSNAGNSYVNAVGNILDQQYGAGFSSQV